MKSPSGLAATSDSGTPPSSVNTSGGASATPRRAGGDANDDSITVQDLVGGQDNVMLLDVSTEEVRFWAYFWGVIWLFWGVF